MPRVLACSVHSDFTLRKSCFIGCVEPHNGREAALAPVAQLRVQQPSVTRVCWALMASGHNAANIDGEPGGTAGRLMLEVLEVLRYQDLEGVLATVVRCRAGIQLGASGLLRA
jgi:putative IMPACT (imprinted ancient) family translation regulator